MPLYLNYSNSGRLVLPANFKIILMRYTVIFLLLTLGAAIFGFGDIFHGVSHIAKGIFVVFIFLFLAAFYKEAASPARKQ